MNKKYIVIAAILPIIVLVIVSCDLFPPENTLELAGAPVLTDKGGGILQIEFQLYNSGDDTLDNCKVKWYVDDTVNGLIDFDEITGWAPSLGVTIGAKKTSPKITVETAPGSVALPVEYYGVYAWGWDNPPDE
ncbi:MAG: hypothetical protein JSV89_13615 [Spirochaetaceae bacterium]|nr:MAG: hypothetical protein JSV89_13615 [Spirochaetaceae bacterium]